MNQQFIDFLVCPSCKGNLELVTFKSMTGEHIGIDAQATQEVVSGVMKCACGNQYPVLEGVPCFLDGGLRK